MAKRFNKILADLHSLGFDFRINDLDESLEIKMDDEEWTLIDDTKDAIIEMELEELGYSVRGKKKPPLSSAKRAIIKHADQNRYNPIHEYFKSLEGKYLSMVPPEMVGKVSAEPYEIPAFAKTYFDNPDGHLGVWLFRWMVGCIAKAMEQARNPMLVIIGPQRKGKSRFAQWLCPLPDRFREGKIDPDSKDARLRLVDTFIQEVGELGSTTRRADVEALKEHITKMHVHDRMPFGKKPILKPAVCNFVGSVNPDGAGFLNDPTGTTRFLSCQINAINFDYSTEVNVDELWAEAYWFYRNVSDSWELSPAELRQQAKINENFEVINALEDVIDSYLIITGDSADYALTIDIRRHLRPHYRYANDDLFNKQIAKVLFKKGCEKKREPYIKGQPHRWAWYGVKLPEMVDLNE